MGPRLLAGNFHKGLFIYRIVLVISKINFIRKDNIFQAMLNRDGKIFPGVVHISGLEQGYQLHRFGADIFLGTVCNQFFVKAGFFQREIAEAAYRYQKEIDDRERTIVGVNEYVEDEPLTIPILRMDPEGEKRQCDRRRRLREERDNQKVGATLAALREAARGKENLMPFILDAVRAYSTLQEITDVLRDVFGVYQEPVIV